MTEREHQEFDQLAKRFTVAAYLLLWVMVALVFCGWLYLRVTNPAPLASDAPPASSSPRDPAVEAGRVATSPHP